MLKLSGPSTGAGSPIEAASSAPNSDDSAPPGRPKRWNLALALVCLATVMMAFNDAARVGGWSVSDLLYVAAAGVVWLDLLTGRTRHLAHPAVRRTAPLLLATSLVLLTWGTMSSFRSLVPGESMLVVVRFAWLTMIWFWLVRAVSRDEDAFGRVIGAYKIAVLIGAATAILGDMGVPISPDDWYGRQAGYWGHPNSLGAFLCVGVPFFVLDVPRHPDRPYGRPVWHRFLFCGFIIAAIGTTGSITSWAAAVIGVVTSGAVFVFTSDTRRLRFRPLTAMATMVVVGIASVFFLTSDSPVVDRLMDLRSGSTHVSSSAESRGEHSQVVIERIPERLVLGVGFDRTSIMQAAGDDAQTIDVPGGVHNMVLKLTYEAGMPAAVAVVVLLIGTTTRGLRLAVHTRGSDLYPMVLALLGAFVAVTTSAQFQPVLFRRYYWFPVAMIWTLYALCRHWSRQRHAEVVASLPPQIGNGSKPRPHGNGTT